jgi:hypothetical protein
MYFSSRINIPYHSYSIIKDDAQFSCNKPSVSGKSAFSLEAVCPLPNSCHEMNYPKKGRNTKLAILTDTPEIKAAEE